jgi:phosphoenolpyruvate carboxykinase (ATP)
MLGELMRRHRAQCWLVNTGWSGGPYGTGERMCLPQTRAMLRAALDGKLAGVPMRTHPQLGLAIPTRCPGVPDEVLDPRATWADGAAYDQAARAVAERFAANFGQFESDVGADVKAAAIRAG